MEFHSLFLTTRSTSIIICACALWMFVIPSHGNTPGLSKGELHITDGGAATYTIGIAVPPGTAGLQPNVSLTYNSQAGNGVMGMGWLLSGISAIDRCPKTQQVDGAVGSVNHDGEDRFCLDGERMIATTTGGYSAPNSVYHLERDNFTRIKAFGSVANANGGTAPERFEVRTTGGEILQFGYTPLSRITLPGKASIHRWMLNRIADRHGNYIEIEYADVALEQCLPKRMKYTANDQAGLVADRAVVFDYETRPDHIENYVAGAKFDNTQRLKRIYTEVGTNTVREYRLHYQQGIATEWSRLTHIEECGSAGTCLTAHRFDWQDGGDLSFSKSIDPVNPLQLNDSRGEAEMHTGDWNGDGKADLMWYFDEHGDNRWYLSDGDSGFIEVLDPIPAERIKSEGGKLHFGDWNGDGITDVMWYFHEKGYNRWYVNDGNLSLTETDAPIEEFQVGVKDTEVYVGDWNADAFTDLMWFNPKTGDNDWYINDGSFGFTSVVDPIRPGAINDGPQLSFGDWNGDGITDVMWYGGANGLNRWFINDGTARFTQHSNPISGLALAGARLYIGDWNADGLSDAMWRVAENGTNHWYLNQGDMTFHRVTNPISQREINKGELKFGNWDGDDFIDVMWYYAKSGENRWYINDGTAGFTPIVNPIPKGELDDESEAIVFVEDWNGDAIDDFIWYHQDSGGNRLFENDRSFSNLISGISDNLGARTELTYRSTTDGSVYSKDDDAVYPIVDLQLDRYVVATHATSDGTVDGSGNHGMYSFTYRYAGTKAHALGRGGLGFRWRSVRDDQTGIVTESFFRQDFPYVGFVDRTEMRLSDETLIGSTRFDYGTRTRSHKSGGKSYITYTRRQVEKEYELNGSPVSTKKTKTKVDWAGNPKTVVEEFGGGFVKVTNTTFHNDGSNNWLLALPKRVEVTHQAPGVPDITRVTEYKYDDRTGVTEEMTIEPDSPVHRLRTTYQYDRFGNRTSTTVSGSDIDTRSSSIRHDVAGRFPIEATNPLGHTETRAYDEHCGGLTRVTDPNRLTTIWSRDEFCRPVTEARPDGTQTATIFQFTAMPFFISKQVTGRPKETRYVDSLGRETRVVTDGLRADREIYRDIEYDYEGRIRRHSEPYFANNPVYWTTYNYDLAGRRIEVTEPDSSTTRTEYRGLTTIVTNAKKQKATTIKNVLGWVTEVLDNDNNSLKYDYDAVGNLTRTTDPHGNAIVVSYDARGRKAVMIDPDMGTWTYVHNALGELVSRTDGASQQVSMTYDLLGRLRTRTTADGTSTWTYDTATNGIGKLDSVVGPAYTRSHDYDWLGRPSTTTIDIAGERFSGATTYDSSGRVKSITYPGGFVTTRNSYNARGYLTRITDHASGALLWQVTATTARGQIAQEKLGNGLTSSRAYYEKTGLLKKIKTGPDNVIQHLKYAYDDLGNLTQRKDVNQNGKKETFGYDALNRLISVRVDGQVTTVDYDSLGNITYKSDVGSYTYGENGAGPHAVTGIDTSTAELVPGGVESDPQGAYVYNGNGNLIHGSGRAISWTGFNKPRRITGIAKTVDYGYGPEFQRTWKTIDFGKTTYYVGAFYEKVVDGNETDEKVYIQAGGHTIEVRRRAGQAKTLRYYHKDHIGSTSVITDDEGGVVENLSFDPWGRRRGSDWSYASGQVPSSTTKGFTGHEMDDEVGLVNMNARIYDPALGRFLSADTIIQDRYNLQSYNRYSYGLNNPLAGTDPSGHFFKKIVRGIKKAVGGVVKTVTSVAKSILDNPYIRSAVAIVATYWTAGALAPFVTSAIGKGAVAGFVGGAIGSGGDLKAALVGGVAGAAFGFVGGLDAIRNSAVNRVAAHGVIGGTSARLQGGSFSKGFVSSGIAKAFTPATTSPQGGEMVRNTVQTALVGAATAKIVGGNAALSAFNSGLGYLYNQCGGRLDCGKDRTLATEKGSIHSNRSHVVDTWEATEWRTGVALGDIPAAVMQESPHSGIRAAGFALDAADVIPIQSRFVTTGQIRVKEILSHDTLWDARDPDPDNWEEIPGMRSSGTVIGTENEIIWSNTREEKRICIVATFGCSK